ncbi:hypothetical protein M409DRAFT_58984 [Zasmidium cellare ATCC 36951]|uniref:Uncharacterized protein n=1 Tax=Zasmidium cellare ATCC 36951 TaxID=1080233 RepID=A0A6A6C3I3_ZASCE|nr:uncharacterized protein M409DRAFT_58984 [Zasmidium cellare ATCC 36951]KAF2161591.1 hypothetical protein M409DRAFT_58984 [Zasmidium cellare ATCC 36951]
MGLLDKIEDKLGGSNKHEEQRLEQQQQGTTATHGNHGRTSHDTYNTTIGDRLSDRQHPISSSTGQGSGIVGGTAVTGGAGSEALTGSHGYGRDDGISSTSDRLRDTRLGGNTNPDGPRQPFDPYSSKGQQIAANAGSGNTYGASTGRAEAGDIGSRRNVDDPEVRRTYGGGVSNGKDLKTGPHHHLENRDAVPTAGGHKVGAGATSNLPGSFDTYDNSPTTHGQNHYGRDAALAGGAGAAGYGAYETTHGRDSTGPAPNTAGPHKSDLLNKVDPRVDANQSRDNTYGRDTGVGSDKYHAQTTSTHPGSTTTSHGTSGIDRRTYDTTSTNAGNYGQDVNYGNRPSADTPLTQSKDFTERHPHGTTAGAAGVGAGAGALGGSALSHRQGDSSDTRNVTGGNYTGQSSTLGHGSSQSGSTGVLSHGTLGSDDHSLRGSELAKRMGGAYESGYRDGYRDALAHKGPQV